MLDVRKRLANLANKMCNDALSQPTEQRLNTLAQAVSAQDYNAAKYATTQLITYDFKDNRDWLLGVKTLIGLAEKGS